MLVCWPIAALRRYGVNNVSFTIVTGRSVNVAMVCQVSLVPLRNCSTGEGKFQFFTQQSRRIYNHLHSMAVTKAANKTQPLYRSGSEVSVFEYCPYCEVVSQSCLYRLRFMGRRVQRAARQTTPHPNPLLVRTTLVSTGQLELGQWTELVTVLIPHPLSVDVSLSLCVSLCIIIYTYSVYNSKWNDWVVVLHNWTAIGV